MASLYHYNNLKGLKILPQHRISTPKVSPMLPFNKHYKSPSVNPQSKPPHPVFKTISTQKYASCMRLDYAAIAGCDVFLVDEVTTVLYTVLNPVSDDSDSDTFSRSDSMVRASFKQSSSPSKFKPRDPSTTPSLQVDPPPSRKQVSQDSEVRTVIVLQDFYEDCLAMRAFYQGMTNELAHQGVSFVLVNLPGQPYTQYDANCVSLNNVFLSHCLDLLLHFLQEKGEIDILTKPYSVVGFGSGANLAFYHAYQVSETLGMLKGVLSFNGFIRVDSIMMDSLQTCIQTYKSCPSELATHYSDFYLRNLVLTTPTIIRN